MQFSKSSDKQPTVGPYKSAKSEIFTRQCVSVR